MLRSALPSGGAERSVDLHETLYFVWRRWKFILATTIIALLLASAWLYTATPHYTATTQILLDPVGEKLASADVVSLNVLDTLTMDNQIAIVKSTDLLRRVVEKERLVDDKEFGSRALSRAARYDVARSYFSRVDAAVKPYLPSSMAEVAKPYLRYAAEVLKKYLWPASQGAPTAESQGVVDAGAASAETGVSIDKLEPIGAAATDSSDDDVVEAVEALASAVSAKRVGQADVLGISVTSNDPGRAARLATAVAEAYLVDPLYSHLAAGRRASAWINERLPELRERSRESEQEVVNFRTEHNLVEGGQKLTLNQDQMAQLNARLVAARADVGDRKAKVDLLDRLDAQGAGDEGLPEFVNSGPVTALRAQLADISTREAGLATRNSNNYPELIKLRAEHAEAKRALAAQEQEIVRNIRNEYSLAVARQESVEKIWHDVAGKTSLDDKQAIQLRELERTASVNKGVFEDYLKRASLLQEDSLHEARLGHVIVPALRPQGPSFPNKGLTLFVASALGLALGVGVSLAREWFSAGFTTPRQAEEVLGLPLLASINQIERRQTKIDRRAVALPRLIRLQPFSRVSEAARALRNGIQMTNVERPPKVVQVTSAIAGEGKTTAALLLAASSAAAGLKTLIVDADSRNPTISRYFQLHGNVGLVDLLLDQSKVNDAVHFDDAHGLWVLPTGAACENLSDCLTAERVRRLVDSFGTTFDCVVFDTPPMGLAIDARFISNFVDKIIFVVKWGATRREIVRQKLKLIRDQEKVAGVVFNFVDQILAKKYQD